MPACDGIAANRRCPTQIVANWQGQFDEHNKNHHKQVFRQATRRALLDLGLLTITRRPIPVLLERKKGGNFT